MHREQVEAVIQGTIEKTFGSVQTLHELHQILKRTNASMRKPGESEALPLNAGLFQSLFLSHVRLAEMFSEMVAAHQRLHEQVELLSRAIPALQEAVINLQQRLSVLEPQ